MFIFPALLFSYLKRGHYTDYLRLKKTIRFSPAFYALVGMLILLPLVAWLMLLNQGLALPDFLSGFETWMRDMEDRAAMITNKFLVMDNPFDLMVNLLMIAVLPAIGEEFLFRGVLQNFLGEWLQKPQAAIVIASALFSAFHFQFYGFLPRFFIGLFLGYLFYWSGNLWYPILAHFLNNAFQVLMVYLGNIDLENVNSAQAAESLPFSAVLISMVLGTLACYLFYRSYYPATGLLAINNKREEALKD